MQSISESIAEELLVAADLGPFWLGDGCTI